MIAFNKLFLIAFVASLQHITADRCPTSWISWGHHCYRFELEEKATWNDAEGRCVSLGSEGRPSHLASVHSKEEQNFLYEVFHLSTQKETISDWDPRAFIGLLVGNSATDLSWTDGSCVDYVNWYRGNEPNGFPNSAAQISDGNGKLGRWCDQVSHPRTFYYICKMSQD